HGQPRVGPVGLRPGDADPGSDPGGPICVGDPGDPAGLVELRPGARRAGRALGGLQPQRWEYLRLGVAELCRRTGAGALSADGDGGKGIEGARAGRGDLGAERETWPSKPRLAPATPALRLRAKE